MLTTIGSKHGDCYYFRPIEEGHEFGRCMWTMPTHVDMPPWFEATVDYEENDVEREVIVKCPCFRSKEGQ